MEVVDSETSVVQQNESFLDHYGKFVLDMLCKAVLSGWTTEIRYFSPLSFSNHNRLRILRGIDALLKAVETYCFVDKTSQLITGDLMPQTLNALSQVITDEVFFFWISLTHNRKSMFDVLLKRHYNQLEEFVVKRLFRTFSLSFLWTSY